MNKPMMLVSGKWNEQTTFRMISVSMDCPYNEAIYDPQSGVLAVISKEKKQVFHMMPKLDEKGDISKLNKPRPAHKPPYPEERKLMDTFYEYYIEEADEIEAFIKRFAENADKYDYTKFLQTENKPAAVAA